MIAPNGHSVDPIMFRWVLVSLALLGGAHSFSVDVNNPPQTNNNNNYNSISAGGGNNYNTGSHNANYNDVVRGIIHRGNDAPSPAAFISEHGYPVEEYKVRTSDGYILTLYRIPYGAKAGAGPGGKKEPVFIQHGFMSSAMDFLVTGPERALGFVLADAGYDVWLGNTRGSTYSRAHRDLTPDQKKFWQFSFHEIGERDLPAMINYVLRKTNFKKLHYVGHSQGTTAFFVMCNLRPMMQEKIQTMNALAPVAYMTNSYSPLVRYISPLADSLKVSERVLIY